MNELRSTIYELLVKAEEAYGTQDAVRYTVKDEKGFPRERPLPARAEKRKQR